MQNSECPFNVHGFVSLQNQQGFLKTTLCQSETNKPIIEELNAFVDD